MKTLTASILTISTALFALIALMPDAWGVGTTQFAQDASMRLTKDPYTGMLYCLLIHSSYCTYGITEARSGFWGQIKTLQSWDGPFRLRRDTEPMAALARLGVIEDGGVSRNPIVPHDNSPRLPLNSSLHITTFVNVVVEEAEQVLYGLIRWPFITASNNQDSPDSSRFRPTIRRVNCLFTYKASSPVTGCLRTTGWMFSTGSRRTMPPRPPLRAYSACSNPE
jgi:hypothetical protein